MKYGSVCSGVEAATVAWHPLGWEPQWFSEIEPFPSAVLAHHYPDVPNYGDMTKFKEWPNDRPINLLVGGTPCQSFSVAGLRAGLDDPRGNLMLTYLALAEQYRPRWLVWENVPGVLSSNKGRDFGTFLGALGKIGYGFAYRVLDAQYFGVAQRRQRVFVVGHLGDWRRAAAVLFERESLSGYPAPSRETGEKAAPTVTSGPPFSRTGNDRVETEAIVPDIAKCLTHGQGQRYNPDTETFPIAFGAQNSAKQGDSASSYVTPTLDKSKTPAVLYQDSQFGVCEYESAGTLRAGRIPEHQMVIHHVTPTLPVGHTTAVALDPNQITSKTNRSQPKPELCHTLPAAAHAPTLFSPLVRRLTPRECERLQGFPDDYTLIPYRGKDAADTPRYKAMGNSMAVPVMHWIGKRIQMVEEIK